MKSSSFEQAIQAQFDCLTKKVIKRAALKYKRDISRRLQHEVPFSEISDERFEKMSVAYENEQKEITQRREDLKTKIGAEENKTKNTNQFLETIRKYENVTELNRSMLCELIDSIYVYQAEGTGKERKQKVEINYRFLAGS